MAEHLWFTTAHLTILLPQAQAADGISLIEHHMAKDFAVPLHIHRDEEESFYVLDGELRLQMDDRIRTLNAGEAVRVAPGVAHSFRIVSPQARFLTMTNGRFEDMVRSLARPADKPELPPQDEPTPQQIQALIEACHRHGIEFIGPPVD
jgi:quercetin dioxygenase-like cupin family protein